MTSPKEFYKSLHPDYFSDSEINEISEVDRSLLDYHLSSLTSRNQEGDFEQFARRLCEKEICPNLLPTTGPMGGGDSKVDSETFPVADTIALQWYGNVLHEAANERWAFAFSTKEVWLTKVKSDISKIVETKRGYTKAFFVTSQNIRAKKRAEIEDALTNEHKIEVRILDRNWIIERVFAGRHEQIAIDELKVTALNKQSSQLGTEDAQRISNLANIELEISDLLTSQQFGLPIADKTLEAAGICRSLEKARSEVEGAYIRADSLAVKCGSLRQQVESAYQWGWTLFWWFEDINAVVAQYSIVEQRSKDSENIYDVERLSTLYSVLNNYANNNNLTKILNWLDERREILLNSLKRISTDKNRPSASLQAKSILFTDELFTCIKSGDDPSDIFEKFKDIFVQGDRLVGFPLDHLVDILTFLGEKIEDILSYDSLLEVIIDITSKREGEIRAAYLLLKRGDQLMEQNKPVRTIAFVGQALTRLYKYETRKDIVYALYLCGNAYKKIGLSWAARGAYLSGANIAANDFWRYGDITQGFLACMNALRFMELRLGRLPQLLAWHEVYKAIKKNTEGFDRDAEEGIETVFDHLVARLIIRYNPQTYTALGNLVPVLNNLELYVAERVLLYLLGYPDELEKMAKVGDKDAEWVANDIYYSQIDTSLSEKFAINGEVITLSTKILGCKIITNCSIKQPCVEAGESILAVLESILSTAIGAFAYQEEVVIEVIQSDACENFVGVTRKEHLGLTQFLVTCKPLDFSEILSKQYDEIRREIFDVCMNIFPYIVHFNDVEKDIETLFVKEHVAERAIAFTSTFGNIYNVLGQEAKFDISQWFLAGTANYEMKRVEPWQAKTKDTAVDSSAKIQMASHDAEVPPDLVDYDSISHEQMSVVSVIRLNLWDRADWSGAMYARCYGNYPPIMGFIFAEEKAGTEIFTAWLSDLGKVDKQKKLRITIVRGISKKNPHHYRIIVGSNITTENRNKLLLITSRTCTMTPTNPANLNNFLNDYKITKRFNIVPAFIKNNISNPKIDHSIGLYDLTIKNAWEIGMHDLDMAGIFHDDDIIIPSEIKEPPVNKLIEWKKTNKGKNI
jgi:hypothetical protein